MFLEQYNSILSNMLKQKQSLARLREELEEKRGSCVSGIKSLGTWPKTAGIEEGKKRKKLFPKISLKC